MLAAIGSGTDEVEGEVPDQGHVAARRLPMELAIIARAALNGLRDRGLLVQRAWSGLLFSALDMPGFSLSLLPLDDALLGLLDAPTSAPSWPATRGMQPRAGRASYFGERAVGVPDAGAAAVVEWMKAIRLD
jgi:dihydroxyacetone kinase